MAGFIYFFFFFKPLAPTPASLLLKWVSVTGVKVEEHAGSQKLMFLQAQLVSLVVFKGCG